MQKTALRFLPLAALCAAGMLVGAPLSATAQRGKAPPPEAPPPAQPVAVKVARGETAEIALRISGR